MPAGPDIILTLKVLVAAVTVLFAASLAALLAGQKRLHGRINRVFFALTMLTVVGFELLLRLGTDVTAGFSEEAKQALRIHLGFAVPSALLLPLMLWSGVRRRRKLHRLAGVLFLFLWAGTAITGIVYLPHE
jgi:hypothetical protein